MRAIPTTYAATLFRSRLEARWAAFFDLCGWRWVYEPFDLDGWAPDFMLIGHTRNLLVEVKPIGWTAEDADTQMPDVRPYRDEIDKAIAAYHGMEVLLLGASPLLGKMDGALGALFWGGFDDEGLNPIALWQGDDVATAAVLVVGANDLKMDFRCSHGDWTPRIGGGDPEAGSAPIFDIAEMWSEAGNQVQWMPSRTNPIGCCEG